MAKKKMTLEEKLEEAIVSDMPYEIPENWIWVQAISILDIVYGKNLPVKKLTEEGYPVFGANGYIGYFSDYNIVREKVLISCRGAYSGSVNIARKKSFITNNSLIIRQKSLKIENKFLFYMLNAMERGELVTGTAQPQVTVKAFDDFKIILPPLKEQQRIVGKIESLFGKLDKAKELIEEAREEFENRKAAILEKAFCGELTKNHKYENDDLVGKDYLNNIARLRDNKYKELLEKSKLNNSKKPKKPHKIDLEFEEMSKGWIKTKLYNLIYDFKYGTSLKSDYGNEGKPVIRIPNLDNGYINHADMKYLKEADIDENNKVEAGDIVIIRSNGSPLLVGKTSIITETERDFAFASYLIRIRGIGIEPKYLYYVLNSNMVKSEFLSKSKSTSGINNINTEELGSSIIPVPAISEQRKIVKILDGLLEEEEKLSELTKLEEQIELIKKAILAKAFRGELGTNNPEEESAIELLKEILSGK